MSAAPTMPDPTDGLTADSPGREREDEDDVLIEQAMRRRSDRRQLVVWEGDPVHPGPALSFAHDSGSIRSEKLRSLRTELLMRLGAHTGAATFTILGAHPGEGRSQLCCELALAFAQLGGRTLLVDANLRNPKLNKLFLGARSTAGLSEMLLGRVYKPPLYRVVGPHSLALLTTGTPPPNPVDLLSGGMFERLVADWSNSYDYVLIDAPPVAVYSDGVVIANAARNVVLVAHRHQTSYAEVTELQRRLDATQAQIIGAVLNDF